MADGCGIEQAGYDPCCASSASDNHAISSEEGSLQSSSRRNVEMLDQVICRGTEIRRRRGRPPKLVAGMRVVDTRNKNDVVTCRGMDIKRRRGRPPKVVAGMNLGEKSNENDGTIRRAVETRRRRGRPRKVSLTPISSVEDKISRGKKMQYEELLAKKERKRIERQNLRTAKENDRLLRKAVRDAKRKKKLEKLERKRAERLERKELKKKILQQKRERRERERELKRKSRGQDTSEIFCDEDTKVIVPSPCDLGLPYVDISVFWKIFVLEQVFLNRWLILCECPSYRYGVVAYMVIEQSVTATEVSFHETEQAERNRSAMFNTVCEARFVPATKHLPSFFYAVVLMRDSVSLHDLWTNCTKSNRAERKAWSWGTIIELTYEAGYTFRNIEMSYFRVDARTRRLFLDNATEVVVSSELKDINLMNDVILLHNCWRGSAEYAPLSWHHKEKESVMRVADCAEVLLYMVLEMAGFSTWRGFDKNLIKHCKEHFDTSVLPSPLTEYWGIVRHAQAVDISSVPCRDGYFLLHGDRGPATCSVLDFRSLFTELQKLYKIYGGVMEEDAPYDYETFVDPSWRNAQEASLIEMRIKRESLRYKLEGLKADCMSLFIRRGFAHRIAAEIMLERFPPYG